MQKLVYTLIVVFSTTLVFSQSKLSAEALQSDAELLWRALNELHPGLYRHTDSITLTKEYEQLLLNFSTELEDREAFRFFSKFTSSIKCGHTYLNPFNQSNKIIASILEEKVLLPFTFSIFDKKIVVEKSFTSQLKKYDVITRINGIETQVVLDDLAHYIKADGDRARKRIKDLEVHLTSKYEYFDYYFPMVFGFEEEVAIETDNGVSKNIQLISKEQRSKVHAELYPQSNSANYDGLWNSEIHQEYAYLKLGTFVTWRLTFDWNDYLNRFFEELEARRIENLIIDIRGNEGGLTDVTNYLVNKLANKTGETVFRKPHLNYKKVSDPLRPHLTTWSKWFYNTSIWTRQLNATYRTARFSSNKPKRIKKNRKAYKGQTYILINESNSSATFFLAETCKKNGYATLIGSETGGTKQGITGGQIFFLTLPNTKIEVDIPLIGSYPLVKLPDEGIRPDIVVEPSIAKYVKGIDEQLLKAKEVITDVTQ